MQTNRIPGFVAETVFYHSNSGRTAFNDLISHDTAALTPQFRCGLALAALVGGIGIGNPGLAMAGLKFALDYC